MGEHFGLYLHFGLYIWGWISLLNWSAKTISKKIGALIHSKKFLSPEVALYLYKSTIRLCMNTVVVSWLVLLVATWNSWISYKNRYAGLLVFHLLPLCRYCFGRCSSELVELVPLPYYQGRSTSYSDRLHDFFVTIPKYY